MQKKYLEEYKKLRRQVREHVKDSSWSEQIVQRRLAINYFDANKIDHVVLKESKRGLLTIDPITGGIIIGLGPFTLSPQQFIYGIQPYLHVEYKLKCLVIRMGTIVPLQVTGATKDKMTGDIFGCIHGVVPSYLGGKSQVGNTINVTVKGLMPVKKGPSAIRCHYAPPKVPKTEIKEES